MTLSNLDKFYINTYGPTGTNTLVHFYPMNEASGACTDQIGSLNSSSVGGNITQGAAGFLPTPDGDTCYSGNGSSTAQVNFGSNFRATYPISFECWVKITNRTTSGGFTLFNNGGGSDGVFFEYIDALTWLGVFANSNVNHQIATVTPTNGSVYHYVYTSDGTSGAAGNKIYINGVSQSVTSTGAPPIASSANANLMGDNGGSGTNLNGLFAKACIYNAVLTQAQVTANYNAGLNGPPPAGGAESPPLGGNMNGWITGGFQG